MNNTSMNPRVLFCGLLAASVILAGSPLSAAGRYKYWRCDDRRDLLYVRCSNSETAEAQKECNERKKSVVPPCAENGWLLLEPRMAALIEELEGRTFVHANTFLAEASDTLEIPYPRTAEGYPITTRALYRNPEKYGFEPIELGDAPTGALVVYRGLGGVVLNSCEDEDEEEECQPMILYPSMVRNYRVTLSDPFIPGEVEPMALIHSDFVESLLEQAVDLDLETEEAAEEEPPR